MVVAIAGVVGMLGLLPVAAQAGPSATRSLDPSTVEPGGQVVVTIEASNYGQGGGVTETLPAGFTYVSSSLPDSQVFPLADQQVRFTLQGDNSFTYTVTASSVEGSHTFSGTLRDFDRTDTMVGGDSMVTVEGCLRCRNPAPPGPSTRRQWSRAGG